MSNNIHYKNLLSIGKDNQSIMRLNRLSQKTQLLVTSNIDHYCITLCENIFFKLKVKFQDPSLILNFRDTILINLKKSRKIR